MTDQLAVTYEGTEPFPDPGRPAPTFEAAIRATNLWPLALLSLGESWHNMHHSDPPPRRIHACIGEPWARRAPEAHTGHNEACPRRDPASLAH